MSRAVAARPGAHWTRDRALRACACDCKRVRFGRMTVISHRRLTRAGLALVALMIADLSAADHDERAAARMRGAL